MKMARELFSAALIFTSVLMLVAGHGFIKDPPARQVCYRMFKKCTAVHWTPDELNCGGFSTQWNKNGGKCGVCGDAYHLKNPSFVHPGRYAKNVITGHYKQGQEFDLTLTITTNHKGWSEFRIGDIETPPITQAKLTHLLQLSSGGTRWRHGSKRGTYTIRLRLPSGVTCNHCVLQWWWKVGNSWGCEGNPRKCGNGLGPQETFVNCADISITSSGGTLPTDGPPPSTQGPTPPPPSSTTQSPPPTPTQTPPPSSTTQSPPPTPTQTPPPPPPGGKCRAIGAWEGNAGMNAWCISNCALKNCPESMCVCN